MRADAAASLQSCPTLCDPIDGSQPGSPIPGNSPGKNTEWVAISFSNRDDYTTLNNKLGKSSNLLLLFYWIKIKPTIFDF